MRTLILLLISCVAISLHGQVSKVKYRLVYDEKTETHDVYIKIVEGSTVNSRDRIQFNSQISIVAPTGTKLHVHKSFMPLQENRNLDGKNPTEWKITAAVEKAVDNEHDAYSITPKLTPTAFYNNLTEGQEIKLFSLALTPKSKCGEGLRLFENGADPSSSDPRTKGSNFNNGFTLGEIEQKFQGNLPTINKLMPHEMSEIITSYKPNEKSSIELKSGAWDNADSYLWKGPNGFTSTSKNVMLHNLRSKDSGVYNLTISNKNGCSVTKSINVNVSSKFGTMDITEDAPIAQNNAALYTRPNNDFVSRVYPNPASNFLNIEVKGSIGNDVKADILAIDGRLVMANVINQKLENEVLNKTIAIKLAPGMYAVRINNGSESHEEKVIITE
jgi:hypothetical protein